MLIENKSYSYKTRFNRLMAKWVWDQLLLDKKILFVQNFQKDHRWLGIDVDCDIDVENKLVISLWKIWLPALIFGRNYLMEANI
jgi:hypothetical protein